MKWIMEDDEKRQYTNLTSRENCVCKMLSIVPEYKGIIVEGDSYYFIIDKDKITSFHIEEVK